MIKTDIDKAKIWMLKSHFLRGKFIKLLANFSNVSPSCASPRCRPRSQQGWPSNQGSNGHLSCRGLGTRDDWDMMSLELKEFKDKSCFVLI